MPRTPASRDRQELAPGDLVEVRIEKIVYGGHGLAHHQGRALLVPFAAPGDRLRVRIRGDGQNVWRGSIESILEPSPARREPTCAHFGACGGCHLQHVDRETELAAKREFVRDCLRRIGGIRWDKEIEIDGGEEYGWRSRVDLHVQREAGAPPRIGYFRSGSRELVSIMDCPVLVPALREAVRNLASDPGSIPPGADRLELVAGDGGEIAAAPTPLPMSLPGPPPKPPGGPTVGSGGSGRVRQRIAGFEFAFEAESFSQANPAMAERLVLRAVGAARGALAVDLYAGAGLFTLALAGRFTIVHAVESDPASVRLGRENARANGIDNVRWSDRDVKAWLDSAGRELHPDLVLLDPPRAGAGRAVVEGITELRPRELVYVSCDPATWARDLRLFVDRGYAIRAIAALDMFPRSYHVEAVAHLAPALPTGASHAPSSAPRSDR